MNPAPPVTKKFAIEFRKDLTFSDERQATRQQVMAKIDISRCFRGRRNGAQRNS
jgi:hypothetical protein